MSDLVRREDVMKTVETVCNQYNICFDLNPKRDGTFGGDLPKAILEIPAVNINPKEGAK